VLVKEKVDPGLNPGEPYIGLEHIEAHSMRLLSHGHGADVKSAKTRFRSGDVLYGKLRPYLNKVTRPEFGGMCSTDILVFSESEALDAGYLANYLNQWEVAEQAHHLSNGVELPRVDWHSLSQLPIAYPVSKADQRAIVRSISAVRAAQARSTTNLEVARWAVERFRQAVFAAACAGRLTAEWRESNPAVEPAAALVEQSRRALRPYPSQGQVTSEDRAPEWMEIPPSWNWVPLSHLADISGGIQKQPKRTPKQNRFPYLRVANVLRGRLDLSDIHYFELFDGELDTYQLEPGDLLVVEGNGSASEIGRSAIWNGEIPDCVHQNHIIRVRCREMDPRFLQLFWNSPLGAREIAALAVTSSGLYSLSTKKIGSVLVPVPPLAEQHIIVERASEVLRVSHHIEAGIARAKASAERLSQSILAKAFRGELVSERQKHPSDTIKQAVWDLASEGEADANFDEAAAPVRLPDGEVS
jgi:type I restriction enzyme S subunit